MGDVLITLEETKLLLQITSDTYDDLIENILIPTIEDYITTYCNDDFLDGFPDALKLPAAKMIKIELSKLTPGVTSETIGRYSASYTDGYPKSVTDLLNPYRKVYFI